MLRKLVILAVLALATPAARADVAIGGFLGTPAGLDFKLGLAPHSALDILVGWDTFRADRGYYGHLTYLATVAVGHGESIDVPFRIGIGGAVYGGGNTNIAARLPAEIALKFRRTPIEIYGELSLRLELVDQASDPQLYLDGGVGLRIYL